VTCSCQPYIGRRAYCLIGLSFSLRLPELPPPPATLFPYTTLFRSHACLGEAGKRLDRPALRRCPALVHRFGVHQQDIGVAQDDRSEEHTSELQSPDQLVCRLLLAKKNDTNTAAALALATTVYPTMH